MSAMDRMLLGLFILTSISGAAGQNNTNCKCTPNQACWPPESVWTELNNTVSGRLIQSVPPAAVCYPSRPEYDPEACKFVATQWFNSSFHEADPISIMYPIWANNSCSPIFANGTSLTGDTNAGDRGCRLGRYPVYVVNATEATHVQAAFAFARKWNIRLNVKNTGHNFPGRSTAYGSLSIWTHHMKGIDFYDNFQARSCGINSTDKQMAVTVGAGEIGHDINAELSKRDVVVSAGQNPDVGIVGWFTGGGHGPLSSTFGMGADNVLEATVVTPLGDLVTANACQHPDLFFAIRGGGGGTYGVIIEATVKAFPSPKVQTVHLSIAQKDPTQAKEWWNLMTYIHSELPRLKDAGVQGYYDMLAPPIYPVLAFRSFFCVYNQPNGTVEQLFAPIVSRLNASSNLFGFIANTTYSPTFVISQENATNEQVATGGAVMGSRLLSRRSLTEDVSRITDTFQRLGQTVDPAATPMLLLGNLVANDANRGLDVGLNPAWRDAVVHFIIVEGIQDGAPAEAVQAVYDDITHNKTRILRELDPDSGAYFNEADPFEPDWQYAFFGKNYQRLRRIKETYDPEGLLWCRSCVGSEAWVEDLEDGSLCRVPWADSEPLLTQY